MRVAFDANIMVAGIRFPRWPYEVLQAGLSGRFAVVLPEQVVEEARRHLPLPEQRSALERYLELARCEIIPMPSVEAVREHAGLVRDATDVPIALALLAARVDYFVTLDRDFTAPGAVSATVREQLHIILPAVFLRDVMGWSSEELEAIRHRTWQDMERQR